MWVETEVEVGGVEEGGYREDVGEDLREEGVDLDLLLLLLVLVLNTAGGEGW